MRVLSSAVAQLPLLMYERTSDGRARAETHPAYSLLHDQPNPETTAYSFWETIMWHAGLTGNGYALIESDRAARPRALWQFPDPAQITPKRDNPGDDLYYEYRPTKGPVEKIPREKILHVIGPSMDGVRGLSVIGYARETIGLSIAADSFGAKFFAEGAALTGILKIPMGLKPDAVERLKKSWHDANHGPKGTRGTAVVEGDMDWKPVSISPEDAQFIEVRQFQISDIARMFGVTPGMIGEEGNANRASSETYAEGFVKYTLQPWLCRIAQRVNASLLTPAERKRFYAEHVVDALLRGDIAKRYSAYAVARQWGWMSPNMILRKENEQAISPEMGGDAVLLPQNMVALGPDGVVWEPKQIVKPADAEPTTVTPDEGTQDVQEDQ